MERRNPLAKRFIKIMNSKTPKPSDKFKRLPKSGFVPGFPPPRSVNATGIRVTPIIVTTEPVTTGGNKAINFTEAQKNQYNYTYRIAHVVSVNNDPINRTIKVNLGSNDGVKVGYAVISAEGLVGTVSRVSNFTSTVKLLTTMDAKDPNSNGISATAQGKENEVFGIVETFDTNKGMFLMNKIDDPSSIAIDDTIVSSGVGGAFPRGMVIGKVKDIQVGEYGMTYTAFVEPAASFSDWKELIVVYTPEVLE